MASRDRPGRLDRPALTGVLVREVVNFKSYWRASTFSSTVEPTIYLLAFGFGFGTLVSKVNGLDYVQFVGTGTVATAVLFSSVFPAMFGTFVKREFQGTYGAILAAPVDTEEIVTGEALWIAARAGVFGCAPMLVAIVFGLDPAWGMLLVPFIAFIAGFGWASFGILISAVMKSIDNFSYVTSTVITPLFLVAGTFFPISGLPEWARILANVNPLYHCVQLVRDAIFGLDWIDLYHLAFMVAFGLIAWRIAIWRMEKRLIN
ncbi:ABC transporter permease [Baekduia sp. Peel2402]|uniref:ABC transporter permease n=1 Tax=Baekduia sp. Peel2402 TaxID=3458296 RepID=UPI00403EF6EB